jgi:small subunit ribosomal protein S1
MTDMTAEPTFEEQDLQPTPTEQLDSDGENLSQDAVGLSTPSAESNPSTENGTSESEKKRQPHERQHDQWEPLRAKARSKETVQARVIKWQRNGLDMELVDELVAGHPALKAFMPNDNIDHDPNRNIANYFGKTLAVKLTSVKAAQGAKAPEIIVSHRAVLAEESREAGNEAVKKLKVGDIIEVKVKTFDRDNVNVDLGPGVDAVIRLRDLAWQHVEHPYEIVKRGETVSAKVLALDRGRRQVRLGIRQLTEDPELAKYAEYQPGQIQKGRIATVGNFGAEIELPNGLIAFLPMSEIAWHRIGAVSEAVSPGDEMEVKLLTVDTEDRRITVSRKQLIEDPARLIESTFKPGTDHNGTIKEVNRGGVVVTLEHNAEGFVPRRELSHDRIERLEDTFKIGKPLEGLRVIEFNRGGRFNDSRSMPQITLSLIAAEREAQRTTLKEYRATSKASRYSLADSLSALRDKLAQQESEG